MRANTRFFFTVLMLLLFSAHRLPAPIREIQETPTPAKRTAKAKPAKQSQGETNASENSKKGQTASSKAQKSVTSQRPFAGTWIGIGGWSTGLRVVVSAAQDSAVVQGPKDMWGDRQVKPTVNGNTLSWTFLLEKWTMVLENDGKTAVVTQHAWPAGVYSGTFQKAR